MVKISIDIPEENFERLKLLSQFYNKESNEIIKEIINITISNSNWILDKSKEYKVPINLSEVFQNILNTSFFTDFNFTGEILKKLEGLGFFYLENFEFDLDTNKVELYFERAGECDIFVHDFSLDFEEFVKLRAKYYVKTKEYDDVYLERMKNVFYKKGSEGVDLPTIYSKINKARFFCDEDESSLSFITYLEAESLDEIPKIPTISEVNKQVLIKAGINLDTIKG